MRYLSGPDSEVLVDRGLPRPLLPPRSTRRKALVLTQPGAQSLLPQLTEELADIDVVVLPIPDRDKAKTLKTLDNVYHRCAEVGIGRHDTIVGVGGGATTDLSGFVAATWLRGIEAVHIPTTLLGAVDAAIGGKTGVNLGGKNLVGAFWLPTRVVVDLDVLDALPEPIKQEGSAEIYKAGLVGDPGIISQYREEGAATALDVVVPAAIGVKTAVVRDDPRETGRRAILNFGHTIGHAVEYATGIPHGHAVAIGMVAALVVSERRVGFTGTEDVISDLKELGLPVAAPPSCNRADVITSIGLDKKIDWGGPRMVLLAAVGQPIVEHVTEDDIAAGFDAIGLD